MSDRQQRQPSGSATAAAPGAAGASSPEELGDFTTTWSVWIVVALAVVVGAIAAGVALALLDLIGLFTHIAYYGRIGDSLVQPTLRHFGDYTIVVPVIGGLIVGAMAYWGSEQIRGHGIPEAMEAILIGGSKVKPRLAILKPVSSAVSIGTGGPFGAEGPIIMTGGAFGSLVGQLFKLSANQRRTLLVAGSCAGMTAVFGTPVAAALFGVELLVFELKPRSMAPIAVAVVVAEAIRDVMSKAHLISALPLFAVPPHGLFNGVDVAAAGFVGVVTGLLAWVLTGAVYGFEDLFKKLPIHWAWWPAIGGIAVGVGGIIDPKALGVGYSIIRLELNGKLALTALGALLVVKLIIWSLSLGSGTSGGILAPLLIMGAAMGGILSPVLPGGSPATWALMGMGGTLAGVTRSPFTSVVFAFELTHDTGSLLPLLAVCTVAHLISSLLLKRSILTEKVARRGYHIMREYVVDPVETLYVREAMGTDLLVLGPDETLPEVGRRLAASPESRRQRLFPVVHEDRMLGVVSMSDLMVALSGGSLSEKDALAPPDGGEERANYESVASAGPDRVSDVLRPRPVVAFSDEILRTAADRMAEYSLGALPVVDRDRPEQVLGVLTEFDLLKARQRQLEEERHRERILTLRLPGRPAGGDQVRVVRERPPAPGEPYEADRPGQRRLG
jgi:CIC family chloride channel protein